MSNERSNSAVRNLRFIFENKSSQSSSFDPRGRSPNGLLGSDKENDRPKSKIRTSFIPVELAHNMASNGTPIAQAERRSSFIEGEEGGPLSDLRQTITRESDRREEDPTISEAVPEAAVVSPDDTPKLGAQTIEDGTNSAPAQNPDKPVTGAEDETSEMRPADPTSAAAVSGGQALSSASEDLRTPSKTKKTTSRPSSIASRPGGNGTPKSPHPGRVSAVSRTSTKPPRASLTAPTAASVARAAANERSDQYVPPPKPKPREPTRPMEISARLTAPTAASRARQGSNAAETSSSSSPRQSLSGHKLAGSRHPGRSSLNPGARPEGTESFLERMTRPTAAFQHKIHEKQEPKSSPQPKAVGRRPKPAVEQSKSLASPSKMSTVSSAASAEPQQSEPEVSAAEYAEEPIIEYTTEVPATDLPKQEEAAVIESNATEPELRGSTEVENSALEVAEEQPKAETESEKATLGEKLREEEAERPSVTEPVVEESVVEEPVVEKPAVEEPVVEEPVKQEASKAEPVAEEPAVPEAAAEETVPVPAAAETPEAAAIEATNDVSVEPAKDLPSTADATSAVLDTDRDKETTKEEATASAEDGKADAEPKTEPAPEVEASSTS